MFCSVGCGLIRLDWMFYDLLDFRLFHTLDCNFMYPLDLYLCIYLINWKHLFFQMSGHIMCCACYQNYLLYTMKNPDIGEYTQMKTNKKNYTHNWWHSSMTRQWYIKMYQQCFLELICFIASDVSNCELFYWLWITRVTSRSTLYWNGRNHHRILIFLFFSFFIFIFFSFLAFAGDCE